VWRSTMLLLCLIAALSGTPLRQAEAASDFAHARAELGQDHVETIDGGVGDDAEVAVLKDGGGDTSSFQAMIPLATVEGLLTPLLPLRFSPGFGLRYPSGPVVTLSPGSAECHAWLQCFLF
jgi:hypothetical protein